MEKQEWGCAWLEFRPLSAETTRLTTQGEDLIFEVRGGGEVASGYRQFVMCLVVFLSASLAIVSRKDGHIFPAFPYLIAVIVFPLFFSIERILCCRSNSIFRRGY